MNPTGSSSPMSRMPEANSPHLYYPPTPLPTHPSPPNSNPSSPTHKAHLQKRTVGMPPRAPLPRRQREHRACFSLEALMEAQKLEKPWSAVIELPTPQLPLPQPGRPYQRQPLLYEVPPLSETQGIGRFRCSVNATEEFIDSTINKRNDSFADLSVVRQEKPRAGSDEYIRPTRIMGNMDTTSPPPPRKAFSRGNSPVRLAIYGDAVDEVGEEELEEIDGRLIFGRKKRARSVIREANRNDSDTALVTTSDPGVVTQTVVAPAVEEKVTAFKKRGREEDNVRGRRKTFDSRNLNRPLPTKFKGDLIGRIRHVTTPEEVEEALEIDDVEEVESFSEGNGEKLMKATQSKSKEKLRTPPKGQDTGRKNKKQVRGFGQGTGAGAGAGAVGGLKTGGPRRTGLRK